MARLVKSNSVPVGFEYLEIKRSLPHKTEFALPRIAFATDVRGTGINKWLAVNKQGHDLAQCMLLRHRNCVLRERTKLE